MELIHLSALFYRPSNSSQQPSLRGSFTATGLLPNLRATHIAQPKSQASNSGEFTYINRIFEYSKQYFQKRLDLLLVLQMILAVCEVMVPPTP